MQLFNPENELTAEQLDELANENFDSFLQYLDEKAAYLKQFTRPLGTYQTKNFAALTKGTELTDTELKRAKEIGKQGDDYRAEKIAEAATKIGVDPKFTDEGIKNIKTNRKQWFD
jgi:hypothetical protein